MSEEEGLEAQVTRQWVSAPGGSCDVRMGHGVVETCGSILRTAVGKPRVAALLCEDGVSDERRELLRRELTDAGFAVEARLLAAGANARTLDFVSELMVWLGEKGVTSDDLVVAIGGVDSLSCAAQACSLWCAGVPLAAIPVDLDAMVEVAVTPRGIAVGESDDMARSNAFCRYLLCDPDLMECGLSDERTRLALALMASSATAENEKSFSRLWDRAPEIMEGDVDVLMEQAVDTLKTRGRLVSSTALAVKQSVTYGRDFVRGLRPLLDDGVSVADLMAEGLRFAARLSCGMGKLSVDDVLTQDELLDRLGLGFVEASVEPERVIKSLKGDQFKRSNRFFVAVPQAIGRVRLASADDGLLNEHVSAWCEAHRAD